MTPAEQAIVQTIGNAISQSCDAAYQHGVAAGRSDELAAVLRTLRLLHDEHSPTKEWARGIRDAIGCVEVRIASIKREAEATKGGS